MSVKHLKIGYNETVLCRMLWPHMQVFVEMQLERLDSSTESESGILSIWKFLLLSTRVVCTTSTDVWGIDWGTSKYSFPFWWKITSAFGSIGLILAKKVPSVTFLGSKSATIVIYYINLKMKLKWLAKFKFWFQRE